MNWPLRSSRLVILVAMALALAACDMRATQEGDEGNLTFHYSPADESTDFDRPLAVGSGVALHMEALDGRTFRRVVDVTAEPETVLTADVDDSSLDTINLSGQSSGEATISVEIQGDGERYTDSTSVRVGEVRQIEMEHKCSDSADAAYIVGQSATISWDRQTASGEKLIGSARSQEEALRSCQADIYPIEYQEDPHCNEAGLHFPNLPMVEPIELFPTEDIGVATGGLRDLGIHVFDPEVLSHNLRFEHSNDDLRVDRTRTVELELFNDPVGSGDNFPICTDLDLLIEIYSTDTCTGPGGAADFTVDSEDSHEFQLRGERTGVCDFDVSLPEYPDVAPWPIELDVIR